MKYPMLLKAPLKDYLWGGTQLKEAYGKESDLEKIAESWELSCHKNGTSGIVNGCHKGKSLQELLEEYPDYAGKNAEKFEKFPVLIKLIDACDKLSIQVHPEDLYAKENENGEYGKTEVWYIVDAKPDASLIYGFSKDVTKEEFENAINSNTLQDILNFVPVKKGDVFFIPAGTVHAICDGILICEIQQNSDTTYRVYDWGRVDKDGKGRPLHIQKALAVSNLNVSGQTDFSIKRESFFGNQKGIIAECEYFKAYEYLVSQRLTLTACENSFQALTFLEGSGTILYHGEEFCFEKGQTYFIPADSGSYEICGNTTVILTEAP